MSEGTDLIKGIGEFAIATLAAIGTVWAALRQGRKKIQAATDEDISAVLTELKRERDELIALLMQSRNESLELRKQLIEAQSRTPPPPAPATPPAP